MAALKIDAALRCCEIASGGEGGCWAVSFKDQCFGGVLWDCKEIKTCPSKCLHIKHERTSKCMIEEKTSFRMCYTVSCLSALHPLNDASFVAIGRLDLAQPRVEVA